MSEISKYGKLYNDYLSNHKNKMSKFNTEINLIIDYCKTTQKLLNEDFGMARDYLKDVELRSAKLQREMVSYVLDQHESWRELEKVKN